MTAPTGPPPIPSFQDWWAPYSAPYKQHYGTAFYPRVEQNLQNRYNTLSSILSMGMGGPSPVAPPFGGGLGWAGGGGWGGMRGMGLGLGRRRGERDEDDEDEGRRGGGLMRLLRRGAMGGLPGPLNIPGAPTLPTFQQFIDPFDEALKARFGTAFYPRIEQGLGKLYGRAFGGPTAGGGGVMRDLLRQLGGTRRRRRGGDSD